MAEEWKPAPGHKDYEVSDRGRIRRTTAAQGTAAGSIVKPVANSKGYMVAALSSGGEKKSVNVHDLVGRAFVNGYKKGATLQHRNHKRTDNRASNLSWATLSDNSGEAKVSTKKVSQIKALAKKGMKPAKIATTLGLQPGVVKLVLRDR